MQTKKPTKHVPGPKPDTPRMKAPRANSVGVAGAVARKQAKVWLAENLEALESSNSFVDTHGLPLARHRNFGTPTERRRPPLTPSPFGGFFATCTAQENATAGASGCCISTGPIGAIERYSAVSPCRNGSALPTLAPSPFGGFPLN